ncbi:MAG: PaREP1 family protein [Methanophagales archaeon]|nr:PaREP1 family protein [Methanophagales archaeon]
MEATSVILPQKLGLKLREKAEEMGYLPEELGVELLSKSLNEELDPEGLVEHYQSLSEKYLGEARELLKKGDLVQASEKFWGATVLTIKMSAAKKGLKLEEHGSLWAFVSTLSRTSSDEELVRFFGVVNVLHRNFYEDEMDNDAVEIIARDAEKLIEKLRRIS